MWGSGLIDPSSAPELLSVIVRVPTAIGGPSGQIRRKLVGAFLREPNRGCCPVVRFPPDCERMPGSLYEPAETPLPWRASFRWPHMTRCLGDRAQVHSSTNST